MSPSYAFLCTADILCFFAAIPFDVVKDPGETKDPAGEMLEILNDLEAAWESYAIEVGVVLTEN